MEKKRNNCLTIALGRRYRGGCRDALSSGVGLRVNNRVAAAAGLTRCGPNGDRSSLYPGFLPEVGVVCKRSERVVQHPISPAPVTLGPIPELDFGLYGLEWHLRPKPLIPRKT